MQQRHSDTYITSQLHPELYLRRRIPVAVLGATGTVGQRMVEMVSQHPWFEITQLTASHKSDKKKYKDAVHWLLPTPLPLHIADMEVEMSIPRKGIALALSALDGSVAEEIEQHYANAGIIVVTNARPHRFKEGVPLIIPEVNMDHIDMLDVGLLPHHIQTKGAIVANPNCAVIGLCVALTPLIETFGVDKVHVTTFQSISGAGFPGVASLAILDNIIPHISCEEERVEKEPLKIFSTYKNGVLQKPDIQISATCTRVPVTEGHLESVSVSLKTKASIQQVEQAFSHFSPAVSQLQLPSMPQQPLHFFHEANYPQPKLHRDLEKGMAVSVGGLRTCSLFDIKFFVLSHNTIKGAAGGSIQIAELLVKKSKIFW